MNAPVSNISQRLFIELGTALQIAPDGQAPSVTGELIGMRVGHYLIVRIPQKNQEDDAFETDVRLHVKYILSDDILGFKSRIIKIVQNPDFLIFLEYPQDVRSCNIRATKRVKCFLPAQILLNNKPLDAMIVNINKSGCLAQVESAPQMGSCTDLAVTLQLTYGQFETLTLTGEIRTESRQGSQARFGILFNTLDGFSQNVLNALVPALNL